MNQRYTMFCRAGVFYYEDKITGKQLSLRTKDEAEAKILLNAKNESIRQPILNLQIAKAYLIGSDNGIATRTWQHAIEALICWHLGASQGDIANLRGEDVDWQNSTISFTRKKTGVPVIVHLGMEALNLFKDMPAEGALFPHLSKVRAGDRATEFKSRCRQLGIGGVTLHSYRYAWAERAKVAGMPERFAQEALGHNSKAVHRAYAKRALMKIPSLEVYEREVVTKV